MGDSSKLVVEERKEGNKGKKSEQVGEGEGEAKNIRSEKVSAMDQSRVKDSSKDKVKKCSSKANDGANDIKMSTIQVVKTDSLSHEKEGCGVISGEGSKSKILGGPKSGKTEEKSVNGSESKPVKKLKRAKSSGEVWEGFHFEKPYKVKCERPIDERKTEEKVGKKRKADEMSKEEKKRKKTCTEEKKKTTEDLKKSTQELKKTTEEKKKTTEDLTKRTEEKKKITEEKKKTTEDLTKRTEEKKKSTDEEKKKNVEPKESVE